MHNTPHSHHSPPKLLLRNPQRGPHPTSHPTITLTRATCSQLLHPPTTAAHTPLIRSYAHTHANTPTSPPLSSNLTGLYYFGRIRMPMPALAEPSAHTASLCVLIIYLGLVIFSGIKLALMEEGTVPPPPYFLRVWGLVSVGFHHILYLPALSILFSAMHCGIVHYLGNSSLSCVFSLYSPFLLFRLDLVVLSTSNPSCSLCTTSPAFISSYFPFSQFSN